MSKKRERQILTDHEILDVSQALANVTRLSRGDTITTNMKHIEVTISGQEEELDKVQEEPSNEIIDTSTATGFDITKILPEFTREMTFIRKEMTIGDQETMNTLRNEMLETKHRSWRGATTISLCIAAILVGVILYLHEDLKGDLKDEIKDMKKDLKEEIRNVFSKTRKAENKVDQLEAKSDSLR